MMVSFLRQNNNTLFAIQQDMIEEPNPVHLSRSHDIVSHYKEMPIYFIILETPVLFKAVNNS